MKQINQNGYNSLSEGLEKLDIDLMPKDIQDDYLKIYSSYSALLYKYLLKNTSLGKVDQAFVNSDLVFNQVNLSEQDIYQYLSEGYCKYFFLRNKLHINRLNEKEREYLYEKMLSGNETLFSEDEEFVSNTYRKVILEQNIPGENYEVFYGPITSTFLASASALIIGFRYEKYNYPNLSDEEWNKLNTNQGVFIYNMIPNIEKQISSQLGLETKVIQYSDSHVQKHEDMPIR